MLTKSKKIRFRTIAKNPLAEKLKAKHAKVMENVKSKLQRERTHLHM